MNDAERDVNPVNPACPICGAVDWFSDTRWDYVMHVVHKGTLTAISGLSGAGDYVIPFEGYVCRVCRFLRLRNVAGTLEITDPATGA
ncbi:MAG: hypothetical protein ABI649_09125 [Gaiellaceae bacterium]